MIDDRAVNSKYLMKRILEFAIAVFRVETHIETYVGKEEEDRNDL